MERVGEARLAQDAQIQSRFLAGWNTTLNTNINFATRARKSVEKARLTLDAVRARVKGTTWKLGTSPRADTHDDHELSPEAQEEIEKAEDEFVTQTEEAVGVMKNVSFLKISEARNGHADKWTSRFSIRRTLCATSPSLFRLKPNSTRSLMRF